MIPKGWQGHNPGGPPQVALTVFQEDQHKIARGVLFWEWCIERLHLFAHNFDTSLLEVRSSPNCLHEGPPNATKKKEAGSRRGYRNGRKERALEWAMGVEEGEEEEVIPLVQSFFFQVGWVDSSRSRQAPCLLPKRQKLASWNFLNIAFVHPIYCWVCMLNLPSCTPAPEAKLTLLFAQLWDKEEEEEDMANLPMIGAMESIIGKDPTVTMEDIFRDLHSEGKKRIWTPRRCRVGESPTRSNYDWGNQQEQRPGGGVGRGGPHRGISYYLCWDKAFMCFWHLSST